MPTPYINREQLEAYCGPSYLALPIENGVDVDAVIEAANGEVDAHVAAQCTLPPIPEAIAQMRGAAARLAAAMVYGSGVSENVLKEAEAARKFLDKVMNKKVLLAQPPAVDDPATPEDESQTGAACGAAPRRTGRLDY